MKNSSTQQVSDLTVNISEHVDADQLHTFDRLVCDLFGFTLMVEGLISTDSKKIKSSVKRPDDQTGTCCLCSHEEKPQ